MKKIGLICCLWLLMEFPLRADHSVLMEIDGRKVYLSEFMGYYNDDLKLGKNDMQTSFQQFLRFQLKVADARCRRLDTLPDFRRQCDFLQMRILKEHFTDKQLFDSYVRQWVTDFNGRRAVKEWVKVDVFTYPLSQHPSAQEEQQAVRTMEEWYQRLCQTQSIHQSDEVWAKANGIVHELSGTQWTPMTRLLNELRAQQAELKNGAFSHPVYTPVGISLIRWVDRRDVAEAEDVKTQVAHYLDEMGLSSPVLRSHEIEQWREGTYKLPEEVTRQLQQIYDGLLATYWEQWSAAPQITPTHEALTTYFREHKHNYRWEYPHFKGAVIHCRSKKAASKIKKRLKKLPMNSWEETFQQLQQEDPALKGELECGLFQIGKNIYVDRLAFKCGTFQPKEATPYTFLLGKKLKKGPENYEDIREQVTADYKKQLEKDRFSQLYAHFKVEINEDVLKTVNSCGNK